MKKSVIILIIVLTFFDKAYTQRETDNWYFGNRVALNFNQGNVTTLSNSKMFAPSGCSSISDKNGNLLFYTNGEVIFNKNNDIMNNQPLFLIGDKRHTQSSIIIPKPKHPNIFYVFYVVNKEASSLGQSAFGIYYSEIDMTLNNGLGAISISNKKLFSFFPTEKISAVHHNDGMSIWLVVFGKDAENKDYFDKFYSFKIDSNSINPPVETTIGSIKTKATKGQLKIAPNGKKIALANKYLIDLLNFNSLTGKVSNPTKLFTSKVFGETITSYGLEFSNDSNFLYSVGYEESDSTTDIYQYDLKNNNTAGKMFLLSKIKGEHLGSLQLSNNGKIYQTVNNSNSLGVINAPNNPKSNSSYQQNTVSLGTKKTKFGLPNFIQSYFRTRILTKNGCVRNKTLFKVDTYATITEAEWDFGDGNTSSLIEPEHVYNSDGEFNVTVTITINGRKISLSKKIKVHSLPQLTPNQRLIQCDFNNDDTDLFDLNDIATKISTNQLELHFFKSLVDAQNNQNKIENPESFQNESNPQEIFVKAINTNGCYDFTSFFIESSYVNLSGINNMVSCEDSDGITGNNIGSFNLANKLNEIRNDLGIPNNHLIRFYNSLVDAQTTRNEIPEEYTSESKTIWVRVDNETGCGGIASFNLIVNSPPQLNIQDNYTICYNSSNIDTIEADSSNTRFEWKNKNGDILSTNRVFALENRGIYTLTVYKTENGIECSSSKNFQVKYPPSGTIQNINIEPVGNLNNVTVNVSGNSSYEFSLNESNYFGNGSSFTFLNVTPGVKSIFVRDVNNCEPPFDKEFSIIGYPSFFTPNEDGKNDTWNLLGISNEFFPTINITIFNRFGRILHKINNNNYSVGWDGYYNGILLPPNSYWFNAELIDNKNNIITRNGSFSLIR